MTRTSRFLLFALLVPIRFSGQQILMSKAPDPSHPTQGWELKHIVVPINMTCGAEQKTVDMAGTGFLVSYPDPRLPKDQEFVYLVTNRHVAQCWDRNNAPTRVRNASIRLNLKNKTSSSGRIDPDTWFYSKDPSADIAIMPIHLPNSDLDIEVLPFDYIANSEWIHSEAIAEGSPILFAGYFYQFPGQERFQPIVRQGIIAMMPDESMKTVSGLYGKLYLGDIHIFGGNSGSPVMVSRDLGLGGYKLLGIMSGYYYEDADFSLEVATTLKGTLGANSGVAMIVPGDLLRDLFNQDDVSKSRDQSFSIRAR